MQLASSIATRAVRWAPRGQAGGVIPSTSRASQIPVSLPGVYKKPTELWHSSDNAGADSAVQIVANGAELTQLLNSTKPSSLLVVKFCASLCSASREVEGKFEQTAAEFADCAKTDVHFATVNIDSNRQLCEKMGIRSVPHVQIFSGHNGKIADFSIAPLKFNTLTSLLADRRDAMLDWK